MILIMTFKHTYHTRHRYYYKLQVGLLVTLLLITVVLIAAVGLMVRKIGDYRREHASDYNTLQMGGSEHEVSFGGSRGGDSEMTSF